MGKRKAEGRMGIWRNIACDCSSVSVFVSASGSDSALPHPSDTGSLGILDTGLRARGSGEHAELAVPEPDSATDCTTLRVRGPSAGAIAIPRIRKRLLRPPLLSARDGLLHHWGA